MASQLQTTTPESNRKVEVSPEDFEEAAFFRRRCGCCVWTFPCYKTKNWERISTSENEQQHDGSGYRSWCSDKLNAFKKVREWSELAAGPKWKTFIRRFNKAPARPKSGKFQYDPCSYALNFDQGPGQNGQFEDDGVFRDFPSRYAAIPAQCSLLKDDAPSTRGTPAPPRLRRRHRAYVIVSASTPPLPRLLSREYPLPEAQNHAYVAAPSPPIAAPTLPPPLLLLRRSLLTGTKMKGSKSVRTEAQSRQPTREDKKRSRENMNNSDDECDREARSKRRHDVNVAECDTACPHMENPKLNAVEKHPREDYLNLKNRTNPIALRNAIAKFNETQKQSVRHLGFGALLHLDIKDMPTKIAYWVLDNFDTKRRVPRSIPTIKEWKDKMLLQRQNLEIEDGGFGNGFCSGPCTEAEVVAARDEHEPVHVAAGDEAGGAQAEAQPDDGAPMEHQEEQVDGHRVEEEPVIGQEANIKDLTDIKVVAADLLKKGKIISDTLSLIMSTISRLPIEMLDNAAFRKTVEATLLPRATQEDMEFWDNLDHIAALLEIEEAALKRDELKRHLDGPSFSLGFTQDWAGVMNVAREVVDPIDGNTMKEVTEEQAPGAEHVGISVSTPVAGNLILVLGGHAKESGCNVDKVMENIDTVTNDPGAASMDVGEKINILHGEVVANVATKTNKAKGKEKKVDRKCRGKLGTAVAMHATWDYARRSSTFSSRLLSEINNVDGLHLANIEMFFFTICHHFHFYLMCFEPKKCKGEIIDNSSALDWDGVDPLSKYGDVPDIMINFFKDFMKTTGNAKTVTLIERNLRKMQRLKMPWRNDTNKVDCGIYTMRHMETYKGGSLRHWNFGLTSDNAKQMKYLRAKYCAAILNAESNIHKERIMADASLYYRATCGDGPHNIDAIVMNNV
ncbi:hypothetical protein C2S53_004542 [Perilla frutescens var. hirtella]|uniref:Ubiquitin-like protease family profile domain-containing protein n=1 Tax=Perilla frutescens var. hirtella TaxID=608512 RepID=A0AAD4JII2_PERFH|nr:hypothetical protein C2S53_004542 [Perilla frutescens var. hirtella]